MKVSGIGRNYNIKSTSFKSNKQNNTTSPIVKHNLVTPSLSNLQSYSNISFRGKEEVLDFINNAESQEQVFVSNFSHKTPVEDIKKTFASKPDKLATFLLGKYGGRDVPPTIFLVSSEQIEACAEILGKKAPKTIAKALAIYDMYGNTVLHRASADKIEALANAMGKKAPKIMAKAITTRCGCLRYETPLHIAEAEEIRVYARIFKEDTDKIFGKALLIRDDNGALPIDPYSGYCNMDKLAALIKVAPNATGNALLQTRKGVPYAELWRKDLKE